MKICSLVPGGTEILFALGLGDQVVGVTDLCDYPPEAKKKPVVSRALVDIHTPTSAQVDRIMREHARSGRSTYALDVGWLHRAKPDLIVTQDVCGVCTLNSYEVAKAIAELDPPPQALVLNPKRLSDIFAAIQAVGEATGATAKAEELVQRFQERVRAVAQMTARHARVPPCLFLVWTDPPIAVGCWISEMVEVAGGSHGLARPHEPYVRLSWDQVLAYCPEFIFVSPGGYDVRRTTEEVSWLAGREGWWDLPAVKRRHVYVMDPGYYARGGPRVVRGLEILAQIIHPETCTGPIPRGRWQSWPPRQPRRCGPRGSHGTSARMLVDRLLDKLQGQSKVADLNVLLRALCSA